MNLFLDANILLGLHGLRPAEVNELRKFEALIAEGELTLWMPTIVQDEYRRNRPRVVADALKPLRDAGISAHIPALASGWEQQTALTQALGEANRARADLVRVLEETAAAETLPADEVVSLLFRQARPIDTDPLLGVARARRELRRPPGKAESLGDSLSWEALLADVPDGQDLYLVSGDRDFRSPLDDDSLHEYLVTEWQDRKGSEVTLYRELGRFLSDHFAAVKVPSDIPKLRLIQQLLFVGSFDRAHNLIQEIDRFDLFTPEQADLIVRNSVRNNQVRWIAGDDDVRRFLERVIDSHRPRVNAVHVEVLEKAMNGDLRPYSRVEIDGEQY